VYFDLIAQGSAWIDLSTVWSIARVVLGLGFVIFVHELGHFLVAKMCGVKCEKFYVGFDFFDIKIGDIVLLPRALLKWQWGETEYGIGVIPLGGYVKMLGQEDNPSSMEAENLRDAGDVDAGLRGGPIDREQLDPRSFRAKSVLQRMAIISAGVVFNLIFAVIFAAIAFKSGVNYSPAIAGTPIPGGPAWEANMDGATIVRIGEKRFDEGYAPFIDVAQEVLMNRWKWNLLPPVRRSRKLSKSPRGNSCVAAWISARWASTLNNNRPCRRPTRRCQVNRRPKPIHPLPPTTKSSP
jgi:regulator of sigma E protease